MSGYLVPTLLQYGEKELVHRILRWLVSSQRASGAFAGPDDGKEQVFDTGQVLRGLLAGLELLPQAADAARRAADYLCSQVSAGGEGGFGNRYNGEIPETVHLYVLPALEKAGIALDEARYCAMARKCLDYYCAHEDFLRIGHLTHFLAYEIEALIETERTEVAVPVLGKLEELQLPDGGVPGRGGVPWTCAPGLAQLAVCWYKVGCPEPADRAVMWLEHHQKRSGGFYGSSGRGAAYFPDAEISWASKFYLDACLLRSVSFFDRNEAIFPSDIPRTDGRVEALIQMVTPDARILEIGCGKGRFLKAIKELFPGCNCTGLDISPELLRCLPNDVRPLKSTMENIPALDNSFDIVYAVEAIEHSANLSAAVAEMIRVARPGGWVAIIDKHSGQWGRLRCLSWERWPEVEFLRESLAGGCDEVTAEPVGYDGRPASDGLMMLWRGRKRAPLTAHQALPEAVNHGGKADRNQ